jgi:hypothetical protein
VQGGLDTCRAGRRRFPCVQGIGLRSASRRDEYAGDSPALRRKGDDGERAAVRV